MSRLYRIVLLALVLLVAPALAKAQNNWVNFNPAGGTVTNATLNVTVKLCSEDAPLYTPQFYHNSQQVYLNYDGTASGCSMGGAQYSGQLSLSEGTNYFDAYALDYSEYEVEGHTTYTLQPPAPPSGPHYVAYPDKFRDVSRCVVSCFANVAAYSTPAYISLGVERSFTLLYRSDRARPMVTVAFDANDPSPSNVVAYSLKLRRPNATFVTFAGGRSEVYFTKASSGSTRLAAQVDGLTEGHGAHAMTAVIRTHYSSGPAAEIEVPARVMIVSSASSPFGAGWEWAGEQQATVVSDGVMIASGDGSVSFFEGCSGTCTLTSPPGDFSVLARQSNGDYWRTYPDGTRLTFGSTGLLYSVTDKFGYGTTISRNGSGQVSTVTDATGYGYTVNYSSGVLSSVVQSVPGTSRTSSFTVSSGNLVSATDPDNVQNFSASYNGSKQLTSLTDRRGAVWAFTYASDHNLDTLKAPSITVSGSSVNPITKQSGAMRALLLDVANGSGGSSTPISASYDHRASIKNPRGNTTYFTLNQWGSPTQTDFPAGPSATAQYNSIGLVSQSTDADGHWRNYTWSGPTLTQTQDLSAGRTVNMTYEGTYHRPLTISGSVPTKTFAYPSFYTTTISDASGTTTVTQDSYGRVSSTTDGGGHTANYYYATSGLRNLDSVRTSGRTSKFVRDAFGRTVVSINPAGDRDSVTYDLLNRVTASTNALYQTTTYAFGDNVALSSVTDPGSSTTSYVRNALGWVTQETRPGSSASLYYRYDQNGNQVATVNRRSQTDSVVYDVLDRPTLRIASDGNTTFSYLASGYGTEGFVAASNAESTDTLFNDAAGRLTRSKTVRPDGSWYHIAYTYGAYDVLLTAMATTSNRWSGSKTQSFKYTSGGALDTINGAGLSRGGEQLLAGVYYPNGLTRSHVNGSLHVGLSTNWSNNTLNDFLGTIIGLDDVGRKSRVSHKAANGDEFDYTALGQLSQHKKWSAGGWNWGCTPDPDFGYEGCSWTPPQQIGSTTTFAYDAAGNLTTGVTSWDSPGNRVLTANGYTFSYDADKNVATRSGAIGNQTLTWNSLGELTQVVNSSTSTTTTFGYDAFGRRVRKTHNGTTTRYLHDGDNLHMEMDGSGNFVAEYSYLGLDVPFTMTKGGQTYYVAIDPVAGSVRGLVRASDNALVSAFEYAPFGQLTSSSDGVGMPLRFAGREWDAETGLYFNRARYYDPVIGRFISEDPIGIEGGTNLYAYAANDPVNSSDPFGLNACVNTAFSGGGMLPPCVSTAPENRPREGFPLTPPSGPQPNPSGPGSPASPSPPKEDERQRTGTDWLGYFMRVNACMDDTPGFAAMLAVSPFGIANMKLGEGFRQPGSSEFTSIDRRFPNLPGANTKGGLPVRRVGSGGAIKTAGTLGTAAAALSALGTSYVVTTLVRCYAGVTGP